MYWCSSRSKTGRFVRWIRINVNNEFSSIRFTWYSDVHWITIPYLCYYYCYYYYFCNFSSDAVATDSVIVLFSFDENDIKNSREVGSSERRPIANVVDAFTVKSVTILNIYEHKYTIWSNDISIHIVNGHPDHDCHHCSSWAASIKNTKLSLYFSQRIIIFTSFLKSIKENLRLHTHL